MDRVDQEGVDLLETLTSKSVGDVGERILFDDIEAESDGAAAELTTTAPMVPSTVDEAAELDGEGVKGEEGLFYCQFHDPGYCLLCAVTVPPPRARARASRG